MAIKFIEGFELNAATSASDDFYLERKFSSVVGTPAQASGYLYGSAVSSSSLVLTTPAFADQDVWILHWAWRLDSAATASQAAGVRVLRAGVEQLSLDIRSFTGSDDQDDRFYVDIKRDATTIATAGPFWAQKWYRFEFKVTVDPSAGTYELKVNGTTAVSGTGANTAQQGVADADQFVFSLDNGLRTMRLDHVVIADDTGASVNDFFGETLVAGRLPNADGDDLDWTPSSGSAHYSLVNEAMPDSNVLTTLDPQRVTSDTVSDVDRWHVENLASVGVPSGASILGVQVETCARMEASGSRTLRAAFKDTGGSTAEGDDFVVDTTAFGVTLQVWETNPATASSWTVTSVDAGQFGVKVQA